MTADTSTPPVDAEVLKELCDRTHDLAKRIGGAMRRLTVQAGDYRVDVEWDPGAAGTASFPAAPATATAEAPTPAEEASGHKVAAPLVGTFYRSPEPGADPFVEEGATVEAGQDVAIIEAMKIMNRIQTDVGGVVRSILVSDGEMVEFGQALIIVDPAG